MSAVVDGTEYTVTATATSLTVIIGSGRKFFSVLALRAGEANLGTVYIGKSAAVTVAANRIGYLQPLESVAIDMTKANFSSDSLFIIGTPGDILHVWFHE